MGLIKAVVALTIAVVLSNMLKQFGENNKDKAYMKYIKQYTDNTCYSMLIIIVFIMLLF